MHLASYIGLLDQGSQTLADSFRQVAQGHREEQTSSTSVSSWRPSVTATATRWLPWSRAMGKPRRASPSGCMPKGCRRRARAAWGC